MTDTKEIIVDVLRGYDEVRSIGQIANEIVRRLAEAQPALATPTPKETDKRPISHHSV